MSSFRGTFRVKVVGSASVTEPDLTWTLNCNNIAQAFFIPACIYALRRRKIPPGCSTSTTGLRAVGVIGALSQMVQSLLWSATTFFPAWRGVSAVLFAGACFGGVCTGCVQARGFPDAPRHAGDPIPHMREMITSAPSRRRRARVRAYRPCGSRLASAAARRLLYMARSLRANPWRTYSASC